MRSLTSVKQDSGSNCFQVFTKIILMVLAILISVHSFAYEMIEINNTNTDSKNNIKTVLDTRTGLEWQYQGEKAFKWTDAIKYCQTLTIGHKNDWYLPSTNELFTIINHSKRTPAIDESLSSSTAGLEYWTSTKFVETESHAWYLNFRFGSLYFADKKMVFFIRCVRDNNRYNANQGQKIKDFPSIKK